ncbi:MAG: TolC family protein [Planctomycetaceae bacterium]
MLALTATGGGGCSRSDYREQADRDAYDVIEERNHDSRWAAARYGIEIDPRSRFYDVYDPDNSPMPTDDPASHRYMHQVDGKSGWGHWHDNGHREALENLDWRAALDQYVTTGDDGSILLNVDSALRLAYVHSPAHQLQLETLYLSALDVSEERFRLDTQFFGGNGVVYRHNGSLVPASLNFDSSAGRFVISPPGRGIENNRLTVNTDLRARRQLATAGDLLVGFANSFVYEFSGGDANLTASLANFTFIQPLLRGAGRDIALEQLTFDERNLLANLRAYGQYRQGFYTQVVIGELGVTGPRRGGSSTNLQSFSGAGGFSGYLGLLSQIQRVRNSEDNLILQERTLERLIALYDNQLIDLTQVDQFRQDIEAAKADLLDLTNNLKLALDNYKTGILGLPPNIQLDLDQSLIGQFQLFSRETRPILQSVLELQTRLSTMPDNPEVEVLNQVMNELSGPVETMRELFNNAEKELAGMEAVVPIREQTMSEKEKELFRIDRERLQDRLLDLKTGQVGFDVNVAKLESLRDGLTEETRTKTLRGLIAWVQTFLPVVERLSLVPAQARLESITVEALDLDAEQSFQLALNRRLDFMNGRASLVDRWRAIQVSADALQSVLNVTADGDLGTARNNPLSFRAPTASLRLGLEFDAPLTRLLERNDYRASLIEYQQSRRGLIQSRDVLQKGIRSLLRTLEQRRRQLEIQRRAVSIAMRRVDQTQLSLNTPPVQLEPGNRPRINPTTARDILSAQRSLRNTQNNFLAAWLNHYAARLRLYRELGIMEINSEGLWIERPLEDLVPSGKDGDAGPQQLPPMVPPALIEAAARMEVDGGLGPITMNARQAPAPTLLTKLISRFRSRQVSVPHSNTVRPSPVAPAPDNQSHFQPLIPPAPAPASTDQHRSQSRVPQIPEPLRPSQTDNRIDPKIRDSRPQSGVGAWKPSRIGKTNASSRGWVATNPQKTVE